MELSCICRAAWEVWLDFMGILLYTKMCIRDRDDIQSNLDTAAGLGIHTILFRSLKQAQEELLQLGVDSIY